MELREFAEQILFGTCLEDKLRDPGEVTDDRPGNAIIAPPQPGRPSELHFKPSGKGPGGFPGDDELGETAGRGRLLHFFANHELLATELMALALLRFPEAPAAFRHGVLQTLRDEQDHTRRYLARMKACGVTFGELPVSGYFWRAVAPMEQPIDYVAGLSLTFEQANLDFARHFAARFAAVGDPESATLLERIHHDEIGHVAHGLKWFRRWKDPRLDDWEAFRQQLKFPLSPARARGFSIDVASRQAAGFHPGFIAQLRVQGQSKGRAPTVWVFNPFTEGRLAHGRDFTPVKTQAQLARDLATLPLFLARRDDVVLVNRQPRIAWLEQVAAAGFPLVEWVELNEGQIPADHSLTRRKIGGLRPWAWGPDSLELLRPLIPLTSDREPTVAQESPEILARLHSKVWSADLLRRFLAGRPGTSWLCPGEVVGIAAGSWNEVSAAVADIRRRGHHRIVVKESLGLAGRNAIRLWEPEVLPAQRRWIERATAAGRPVVVEPWLERVADFSCQLEAGTTRLTRCGFTGLTTDARGQFQANHAGPPPFSPPTMVAELLRTTAGHRVSIVDFYDELIAFIAGPLLESGYVGPVGVDAFVYLDAAGHPRLKPLVELNPRFTMGRLTLALMRQVGPGSTGRFRLLGHNHLKTAGVGTFEALAGSLAERNPVRLEGSPVARIREGVVFLNDPVEVEASLAVFEVTASGRATAGNKL